MPDTYGTNAFENDLDLQRILESTLPTQLYAQAKPHLARLGRLVGTTLDDLSRRADANPPRLRSLDKRGNLINEVEFHPAYAESERIAVEEFGLVSMSHEPVLDFARPVPHLLKYAFWYVFGQAEFALACPMSMTDSAIRVLRRFGSEQLNHAYAERMVSTSADRFTGAQFMTEKQGGSDVGTNTVEARKVGDEWRLWGNKWFCSNVSADLALVLARPEGASPGTSGLAMFLMPRILPDGSMNNFRISRLKEKLGTRAMASGEVDFFGAVGHLVGDLGTGFKQMMSMVNSSRLSNAMRSTALMRRSFVEALTSAQGRPAFGALLVAQPLMRATLFRMLLETEAATAMLFHTAQIYDHADQALGSLTPPERALSVPPEPFSRYVRLLTPMLKGVICKRARTVVAEGMEARGGNGYIDDWVDGKLLRDAQLGSIWEGTTSIVALDVQRAILRDNAGAPFFADIQQKLKDLISDKTVSPIAQFLMDCSNEAERTARELDLVDAAERELGAIEFMNKMYNLLAATLLLELADREANDLGSFRKLAVALGYIETHMLQATGPQEPPSFLLTAAGESVLTNAHVELESLTETHGRVVEHIHMLKAARGSALAAHPSTREG
ncbi:acyl-CoA dehydrogenase family protein [Leucobacter aridicollis]|uniref:acyl-CoA dehydrogenase family protein n=1 Tax=Leucobacter aridicollis TaxID=283878 RepID=UPI002107C6B1|nr:acyl-CoA dehydrogenase family protein [Leucobacter aridicollis]UTX51817.1 acyl-CoA dehydrogenase family protein [Leucobacter aridicollis]